MTLPAGPGSRHVSVLPTEVLKYLDPRPGQLLIDATVGAGGHTALIAAHVGPTGRVVGLDRDGTMLELARPRLEGAPVTLVRAAFDEVRSVLDELNIDRVDGLLADLGICSDQLDDPARGMAFSQDGPLDMRMNTNEGVPASHLVHQMDEKDLADLIYRYGEERFSRRIARRIVEERKTTRFDTTGPLAALVRRCVPRSGRLDPATRTFQALRIAVNDELACLENLLGELPKCLKPGGRAVLISFHSLEDRLVKTAFKDKERWNTLTRKPALAGDEETATNPRARSAKLRAAALVG